MMPAYGETKRNARLASDRRFFVMAFLVAPTVADSTQGITPTTITFGDLGPFSGPASVFTPLNYGAEAYLRHINDQGGVNGRKFVTVFGDDSGNGPRRGSILMDKAELAGQPPHRIFRHGVVQVSQARDLFPEMSVEENLRLGAWVRRGIGARILDGVYHSFPRLAERRGQSAGLMSGGEQQVVAIGRALMSEPRLLLLGEPSEGLAPAFVSEIAAIVAALKQQGVTMVMVEQNIRLALSVADRILVLRDGVVAGQHDVRGGAGDEEQIVREIYL
jgi:branched-chain amino acid transport system ATP-binding protein